jgi:acyl-coenzyme A synthetase/AMP-(fatty) acid ligase
MAQIDMETLVKRIVDFPLTCVFTLPPIIHFLNHLNNEAVFRSLANLNELLVAAAPLGAALQAEFSQKLHNAAKKAGSSHVVKVVQAWGMTELSAAVGRCSMMLIVGIGISCGKEF